MAAPEVRALRGTAALPEEFFRLLADSVPQMVWSARADGHNDYQNRRFLDYSGMTPAEISGWGWEKFIHPEDRERCHERWQHALETGEPFEMEYRLRRHDGVFLWHLGSAYPVREGQKISRWFGACTNIEARKRAERLLEEGRRALESEVAARTEALRSSESRLREIIRNEPECVKLLDAKGRLLEMNEAGLRMIEVDDIAPMLGQSVEDIVCPEHRTAFRELTERVCRGERGTLEFEIVGLKGTRRWLQTHAGPFRDETRGETLLLGVTRDVSEEKLAERALARSEQRFRSFMDNLPAVAWIKDSEFRYTWVSRQYERMHAKREEEILGHTDFEIWPAEMAGQFRRVDQRTLRENRPVQTTDDVPFADGRKGQWLVVKFPLPDAGGRMGIGGIRVDITERVELERALVEGRARIEDATRTVRELMNRLVHAQEAERHKLADDLHDLIGQKLTALGINLEFVRQRMPQAGAAALAGRLHQMATLLEETIVSIREVMTDLRPQALDEHGLSAALYQYGAAFEARTGLRVQVTGAEKRLPLPRDVAIALFRIAQEALTNAAKHSGASRVRVLVRKRPRYIELEIEDDGRGPGGAQEPASTGGGWGLRMMRERAEAVGGELSVQAADPGTRVSVTVRFDRAD